MLAEYSRNISYFIDEVWSAILLRQQPSERRLQSSAMICIQLSCVISRKTGTNSRMLSGALLIRLITKAIYPTHSSIRWTALRTRRKSCRSADQHGPGYFSKHTYDDALKMQQANASVYAIDLDRISGSGAEAAG
jgi:hypothetical protein